MQKIKLNHLVRISCKKAAREHGISLYTLGRVTWVADRSDNIEVNLGDKRVIIKSSQAERVKVKK